LWGDEAFVTCPESLCARLSDSLAATIGEEGDEEVTKGDEGFVTGSKPVWARLSGSWVTK
jgi:hypothetical protein